MTDEPGRSAQAPARTLRTAVIVVAPFRIVRVVAPAVWDPGAGPLPVSWEIHDPHRRIRRGLLVFQVTGPDGAAVTTHVCRLSGGQLTPGVHSLPLPDQWNGTLLSASGPRVGTLVTGEMSPICILITAWSTDADVPAPPPIDEAAAPGVGHRPGGAVRTARAGEWSAERIAVVDLDLIVSARWNRDYCIPYPDAPTLFDQERQLGEVSVRVQVKNVQDGTPARIDVLRINDLGNPNNDYYYLSTPPDRTSQPGLVDLIVSRGRVVRPGGRLPVVRFNRFGEHWAYPGNNFYCFRVGFGDWGAAVSASPRDPVADEAGCLHMRFTVFIHCPARNLPAAREEAADIRRLLNRSRYYHAFLQPPGRADAEKLLASYRHRYIVVFNGHGGIGCDHADHPRRPRPGPDTAIDDAGGTPQRQAELERYGGLEPPGPPLEILWSGFAPDQDRCPPPTSMDDQGRSALSGLEDEARRRYWRRWYGSGAELTHFGWCLHRERIQHSLELGPVDGAAREAIDLCGPIGGFGNSDPARDSLIFAIERQPAPPTDPQGSRRRHRHPSSEPDPWFSDLFPADLPRLAFFADACHTRLSSTFAAAICGAGTRFYHGWHYVIPDDVGLLRAFFRRWIGSAGPGMPEGDPEQFEAAYQAAAAEPYRASFHPRLMEAVGSATARHDAAQALR